ncbi:DUF6024 family protein [Cryobacterium sp. N19]|uniref:DUF6024 family protein n=1 Tax=Cryobacterium sp. N19 TaxID=2048288 RepID=UPI000CE31C6A|nr:DUF6024 family protein [Cryobacterium sp. N19]
MCALDAAALHPDLQVSTGHGHYYAQAAELRSTITCALVRDLGAGDFRPYLLHNSTSALMAVLFAATNAGRSINTEGPIEQHYSPYNFLLPRAGPLADWELRTHVSPVTAVVDELGGRSIRIVDAAQSLGTVLTPALLTGSDVAIAPLHKHLGLVVGLGLVLVRRDVPDLEPVHRVLRVAESGAQSIELLRRAASAIKNLDGRIANLAQVNVSPELSAWCLDRGLRPLASGPGAPYVCLTTTDGIPVADRLAPTGWRHFREFNTARFSFVRRGRPGEAAVDHVLEFRIAVNRALGR